MVFALGAVSSALDTLQSLTSSKSSSSQTRALGQGSGNPFDVSAGAPASPSLTPPDSGPSGLSQLSPSTLNALFAAQGQSSTATASASSSPASALQDLFSKLDANGDGQIGKSEFENALGAGGTNLANADNVFNKLDKNGDGSVSLGELGSALKGAGGKGRHHHAHVDSSDGSGDSSGASGAAGSGAADGSNSDPLLQALQASSGRTVTNSDGSTTTTLTNADGSTVTLTSAAATSASNIATSSYNLIQQYLQNEAQSLSSSATNSLSVSV
jgi:Ca2+-binding EF-hand superfamily protein